jgi:hypothetical protein
MYARFDVPLAWNAADAPAQEAYTDLQLRDPCDPLTGNNCYNPQPLSSDLTAGFTNALYTSISRDPGATTWSAGGTRDAGQISAVVIARFFCRRISARSRQAVKGIKFLSIVQSG